MEPLFTVHSHPTGHIVRVSPNSQSQYRRPIKVEFGDIVNLPGEMFYHVTTYPPVIDKNSPFENFKKFRLLALSPIFSAVTNHLRQVKLIIFEGADRNGYQWLIIPEPQGLRMADVFRLEAVWTPPANFVNSLFYSRVGERIDGRIAGRMGGKTLTGDHLPFSVPPYYISRSDIEDKRNAALERAAGVERLRLVEEFNLLHIAHDMGSYETNMVKVALDDYVFQVFRGKIVSAHLANWRHLIAVDGKRLTPEQGKAIRELQYLVEDQQEGLPRIEGPSSVDPSPSRSCSVM